MKQAHAARRAIEPRPEGRSSRAVAGKPHRDAVLGRWLLPLPTIDPIIVARSGAALPAYGPEFRYSHYAGTKTLRYAVGGAVGVGALGVAAQVQPLRDSMLKHGSSRATAPTRRAAPSRGSGSTSSARAAARPCTPGSPAATPATTRRRRCSPSPRCAWPSTTTRRPPVRSPPPRRWATHLIDRLQAAGHPVRGPLTRQGTVTGTVIRPTFSSAPPW